MISRNFAVYLDTQAALVATLPEQPWLTGTSDEKRKASIFYRRAPQAAITPFLIVSVAKNYDDGTFSTGVDGTKIARFRVTLASDASMSVLVPIRSALKTVINNARNVEMNGMRVQCLLIEDIVELDGEPVDGDEAGLPGIEFHVKAAFTER